MPESVSAKDCDDRNECAAGACADGMCEFASVQDGAPWAMAQEPARRVAASEHLRVPSRASEMPLPWKGGRTRLTAMALNATVARSTIAGNYGHLGDSLWATSGSLIVGGGTGTRASIGYNIEAPGDTCGFHEVSDQSAVTAERLNLGPLADDGGSRQTHKPGAGGFGDSSHAQRAAVPCATWCV